MTFNTWKTAGTPTAWNERRPVMLRLLQKLDPDVLLVQELHPDISGCISEALPGHAWVVDDFKGWTQEGNIFFRQSIFQEVLHGQEQIGQEEELRRLFWLRLSVIGGKQSTNTGEAKTALFATAHLTWQGHPRECETDANLRKVQSRRAVETLNRVQLPNEPCFFGGDMNESYWPRRLFQEAGFLDCFGAINLPALATHPFRPCVAHEEINADQALDWLFARATNPTSTGGESEDGKKRRRVSDVDSRAAKPLLASVIKGMVGLSSDDPDELHVLGVAPSDHCPVMAVYRF